MECAEGASHSATRWPPSGASGGAAYGDGGVSQTGCRARLAGSTDLAIRSGVDLPLLACKMIQEGDVVPVLHHPSGVRFRWCPDGLRDLCARPEQLLQPRTWSVASDWSWRDLAPHWTQLRRTLWQMRHA